MKVLCEEMCKNFSNLRNSYEKRFEKNEKMATKEDGAVKTKEKKQDSDDEDNDIVINQNDSKQNDTDKVIALLSSTNLSRRKLVGKLKGY